MGSVGMTADRETAVRLDEEDPLKHLRSEFIIPTRADLRSRKLDEKCVSLPKQMLHCPNYLLTAFSNGDGDQPCIYLCGNSLGLQPRRTSERITTHLATWARKGVHGHFFQYEDSPLAPFLPMDEQAARLMAPIVGALPEEVAVY